MGGGEAETLKTASLADSCPVLVLFVSSFVIAHKFYSYSRLWLVKTPVTGYQDVSLGVVQLIQPTALCMPVETSQIPKTKPKS